MSTVNPSKLAHSIAQTASAAPGPSALWRHVAATMPGLQNAAHFYLHDAQKLTRLALSAAGATVAVDDAEVHYPAHPEAGTVKLRSAELQVLPSGEVLLLLVVPGGGFAVFEVREGAVVEVAADLAVDGSVLAVRALSMDLLLVLQERQLRLFDAAAAQFVDGPGMAMAFDSPAAKLHVMRRRCVVCCPEFQQLLVVDVPSLDSRRHLQGHFAVAHALVNDGSSDALTVAVSPRWVAYCSQFERAPTTFTANASAESALASVARTVSGGIKLVCGITPFLAPHSAPSSAVTVFDVEAGAAFASFSPHNGDIQIMAFDPSGTLLATASSDGTTANVFQIGRSANGEGSVTLLCRLSRGMTPQTVTSLAFSALSEYVVLGTTVGTCHVFTVGDAVGAARGLAAPKDFLAPLLSSTLRVRAFPTTVPVLPSVVFAPAIDVGASTVLVLATASGVVSLVALPEFLDGGGAAAPRPAGSPGDERRVVYSKFLDSFEGKRVAARGAADVAAAADASSADGWRTHVELVTGPQVEPLENFRIPGLPQPSADTAAEWEAV